MSKWQDLTSRLANLTGIGVEAQINRTMETSPDQVTYKRIEGKGEFYELPEAKDGFEVFHRLHKSKKGIVIEVMAFNNAEGMGYYRRLNDAF